MKYCIFDVEANGLLDTVTKIHCLSYAILGEDNSILSKGSITNYDEMRLFIQYQECLVGHNVIRYDIPLLEKILDIKFKEDLCIVDTLGLSWYLFPNTRNEKGQTVIRRSHGLEAWGIELGTNKISIENWDNLTSEEYIHRCEEDVNITISLWVKEKTLLHKIYDSDIWRVIHYISFKLDCAREQEENPIFIDVESCKKYLEQITVERTKRIEELASHMPKNTKYKTLKKPKTLEKADGTISRAGEKWLSLIRDSGVIEDVEELQVISSIEDGNPASVSQVKNWLYSLGWIPTVFKDSVSKTGEVKEVAQISTEGEICPNIQRLYPQYPFLEALEGLTILNHRRGVFECFLESVDKKGYVQAQMDGFTNSFRFKHRKPIANLCKISKPWGKEIRSLITVPNDEYILCGSDMTALEDSTKQSFMYFFDPEYVTQMRVPGYDPHLDIGVLAGLITEEESEYFKRMKKLKEPKTKEQEERFHEIENKRYLAKTVNFACVYGAGPPKIAKTTGMSLKEAQLLHSTYWRRNKAVKQVANNLEKKIIDGQLFIFNPVSKFWYVLRSEKDSFSVINQSTGVYCFDCYLRGCRKRGIKVSLQYHDEQAFILKKGEEDRIRQIISESIKDVNDEVKLNVPLGCSVDFGNNYSLIH